MYIRYFYIVRQLLKLCSFKIIDFLLFTFKKFFRPSIVILCHLILSQSFRQLYSCCCSHHCHRSAVLLRDRIWKKKIFLTCYFLKKLHFWDVHYLESKQWYERGNRKTIPYCIFLQIWISILICLLLFTFQNLPITTPHVMFNDFRCTL